MQQRVGRVRALALNPSILLMDEPFAALDAQTREVLQEELLRLMQRPEERKTVVFITHSIDEAILLGDRIAVLSARPGRVREVLAVPVPRPQQGGGRRRPDDRQRRAVAVPGAQPAGTAAGAGHRIGARHWDRTAAGAVLGARYRLRYVRHVPVLDPQRGAAARDRAVGWL